MLDRPETNAAMVDVERMSDDDFLKAIDAMVEALRARLWNCKFNSALRHRPGVPKGMVPTLLGN